MDASISERAARGKQALEDDSLSPDRALERNIGNLSGVIAAVHSSQEARSLAPPGVGDVSAA